MIGPKDRKFLYRRLEIAESDMSADEKRAALDAVRRAQDIQRKRSRTIEVALWVAMLCAFGMTLFVMLRGLG